MLPLYDQGSEQSHLAIPATFHASHENCIDNITMLHHAVLPAHALPHILGTHPLPEEAT
jgi:hypothetical protein